MNLPNTYQELTPHLLLRAYAAGIFPMAETRNTEYIYWVAPKQRGVLPIENFHIPRRLKRTIRNRQIKVTCNIAFAQVVALCAESTKQRPDTWINPTIENAVNELHRLGHAHSIECWLNGSLIGGLYGISLGSAFFGESMFSRINDASKIALVYLTARLKFGRFRLFDTQFMTAHLSQFGAKEISSKEYLFQLEAALKQQAVFPVRINNEWLINENILSY